MTQDVKLYYYSPTYKAQAEDRNEASDGSKTCKIQAHKPSLHQRWYRLKTVDHGPKRSGNSRQDEPVRTTHSMPSTTRR